MGSLFSKKNVEIEKLFLAYYLFNNYNIIYPLDISLIAKNEFVNKLGFWDPVFEMHATKHSILNYNPNAIADSFLKDFALNKSDADNKLSNELSILLRKSDGDFRIKTLSDLAWVKANWDLFEEEKGNEVLSYEIVQNVYLKIKNLDKISISKGLFVDNYTMYKQFRTNSDLNKLDYMIIDESNINNKIFFPKHNPSNPYISKPNKINKEEEEKQDVKIDDSDSNYLSVNDIDNSQIIQIPIDDSSLPNIIASND